MENTYIEILAPAGDMEMVRAAVFSGADCVYLGFEGFNARRAAKNFTEKTLSQVVEFCHARGAGVYVALNTVIQEQELEAVYEAVKTISAAQADAIIVQDWATAEIVSEVAPHIPLHASTQMSIYSVAGVKQLEQLGFSRAILARELSFNEIETIAQQTKIELEVFVHGALCVCVSGQCYMSTMLGGRSANRGNCAGSCRLPFRNFVQNGDKKIFLDEEVDAGLSLKDLSILKDLPKLAKIGVKSAKIEGRLRGPEYCSAVVNAAIKARNAQQYDEQQLADVFSRRGFTDGWLYPSIKKNMFGQRTQDDYAVSKQIIPQMRALYRREMPRVPVTMTFTATQNTITLSIFDGVNGVSQYQKAHLGATQKDMVPAVENALKRTGGTPFYAIQVKINIAGFYIPLSQVNALKKQALQWLLDRRKEIPVSTWCNPVIAKIIPKKGNATVLDKSNVTQLGVRLQTIKQAPENIWDFCEKLFLPLNEYLQVPDTWRSKVVLYLPRVLFNTQELEAQKQIEQAATKGFTCFEAQNIAQLYLCAGYTIYTGFGFNITNTKAAAVLKQLGCAACTLSPELSLAEMRTIAQGVVGQSIYTNMLVYGHLPMMISRACALKNTIGCEKCGQKPGLIDRKGKQLPVICEAGVREIFNAVPLWMGDKLAELPTDLGTLYFTVETKEQVQEVLQTFYDQKSSKNAFTRGLYTKGIE